MSVKHLEQAFKQTQNRHLKMQLFIFPGNVKKFLSTFPTGLRFPGGVACPVWVVTP